MRDYVEDSSFTLPALEDGPMAIGALWNCHDSTTANGLNLFGEPLVGQHLKIDPVHADEYMLRHVKSNSDRQKPLRVEGEVSLELMAGLMKASGGGEYDKDDQISVFEEELLCTYDLITYSVETLPSIKETINPVVLDNILKGITKATHVVASTKYGAKVNASIRVKQTNFENNENSLDNFMGKLIFGPITNASKVGLGILDTEAKYDFEKKIKITSRPGINSQPETIEKIFDTVSSIQGVVEKNIGLKTDETTVYGVPVRFTLVPINQFIEVSVERLYFHDTVLDSLSGYLAFLKDFQVFQYLHKKVLEAEPSMRKILCDPDNPLSQSIIESEKGYKSHADIFCSRIGELLKKYKDGKTDAVAILKAIKEMEKDVSVSQVFEHVSEFVCEGRNYLNMSDADIEKSQNIVFFTNEMDQETWYQASESIKILLLIGRGGNNSYALASICNLSNKLSDIGIKVGVALPVISRNQNSMAIKVNGKEVLFVSNKQIQHVVRVLKLLVHESGPIATRFLTIYASLSDIKLPLNNNLNDLLLLISILENTDTVAFAESYLETRELCLADGGGMKFMINLNSLDSAIESVRKLQYLKVLYGKNGAWVVGKWEFEEIQGLHDSPLVFAFKNGQLHAVCCDILDAVLLNESFVTEDPKVLNYVKLLQPAKENLKRTCFYKQRAEYALNFASKFAVRSAASGNVVLLRNLPGFEETPVGDVMVRQWVQELMRAVLSRNWRSVYVLLIDGIIRENEEAEAVLRGFQNCSNIDTEKLTAVLKSIMGSQNTFYGLVITTIERINAIEKQNDQMDVLIKLTKSITTHEECPKDLVEQLEMLECGTNYSDRMTKTIQRLKNYEAGCNSNPKIENLSKFIQLLKAPTEAARENLITVDILPKMLSQFKISEEYLEADVDLKRSIDAKNFYGALYMLSSTQVHPSLYRIQILFEKLSGIYDFSGLENIMGSLAKEKLTVEQYKSVFKNEKIQILLDKAHYSSVFLEKIKNHFCGSGIPDYFPGFLKKALEALIDIDDGEELKVFKNYDDTVRIFQRISKREQLPDNFAQVLMESMLNNPELKNIFLQAEALKYWNSADQFEEVWDCNTVKTACEQLVKWKEQQTRSNYDANDDLKFLPPETPKPVIQVTQGEMPTKRPNVELGSIASVLLGNNQLRISPADFLKLTALLPKPSPLQKFDNGYFNQLLPFILQQLKMWGLHSIHPENLSSFVKINDKRNGKNKGLSRKLTFKKTNKTNSEKEMIAANASSNSEDDVKPISRLDLFSCLYTRCHPLIFQDILKIVSQFSMALPLILRDIKQANKSFVCLIPLLKACSTKWEYSSGAVRYNELFTSPFKMIVCVRVGTTLRGKLGKSSILNQVLSQRHTFSSSSDPGSKHGKPFTLDGSVEFCTLTQETASPMLWQSAIQPHYATGTDQVLLLANLHGDVLEYPETVEFLKKIASKFIIFFNSMSREELEAKYLKIVERFGDVWVDHLHCILVDPTEGCEELPHEWVIDTSQVLSDETANAIRSVISEALSVSDYQSQLRTKIEDVCRPDPTIGILWAPEIATQESQVFVDFVRGLGCEKVKSAMILQTMDPKRDSYDIKVRRILNESLILKDVILKFHNILSLPLDQRLLALFHLDKQLSFLTAEESAIIRNEILEYREEKIRSMSLAKSQESENLQLLIASKLVSAFDKLDKISLGLEHIYREIGRVFTHYQPLKNNPYSNMSASTGELLAQGNAIEVLDGEMLDMCGPWFESVCHSICEKLGKMKIFVVSIIGLQSSGKSTLLNALFGCKFAVSVGRCTRGLFMRILYLEKKLASDLNVDAIVVLDTEGLGAPEKLNDENCEQKDRLLATFTMSVSNLTLINVLGESIRDLSDILQIVIVTMARLEKADISPDICMVQHLSERDSSKMMKGENEFANALQDAVALTDKKDLKIGVRNSKSLQMLEQRIKNGDLARLFPPFKNGATVNAPPSEKYHETVTDLYKIILDTIKKAKKTQTFHSWHELIHSYWNAVSKEDYALRFKNIREIQDFIDRGTAIANLKSMIDDAFRKHRDDFSKVLRTNFNKFLSSKKSNTEWEDIKKEFISKTDEKLKLIPHSCPTSCKTCSDACDQRGVVFSGVEGKACELETQDTIFKHIQQSQSDILKHLNQDADALVVAHGNSAKFDKIVAEIIQKKLSIKSKYTEEEVVKIIDEVWDSVKRDISTQMKVIPVIRRIYEAIGNQYSRIQPEIEGRVKLDVLPKLQIIKALIIEKKTFPKLLTSDRLVSKDALYVESQLDGITEKVIAMYKSKQFETGMIHQVNEMVEDVLGRFEEYLTKKLHLEFKWNAIIYALIKFARKMKVNEKEWNELHNPLYILEKREDEYRKKIKIWLQHGFGYESEGKLIGERLGTAIRQLAQKQGDEVHVKFVAGHTWLISSENVRLEYFVGLAKEVQSGDKSRAVAHFARPKYSITEWFNNRVNGLSKNKGEQVFRETVNIEYSSTTQTIRNIENAERLRDFVKDYLTQVKGVEYNPQSSLDFAAATEAEFKFLQQAVLKKLAEDKEGLERNISITPPSEQEKIQKILGCCEHCYWCGTLCWGEFGHDNNRDDTRKHHACHQARGLIGVHDREVLTLRSESCDEVPNNRNVRWPNCGAEGMLWPDAKLHSDFAHWIFTLHSKNQFNELMKWFFANLHNEIAESCNFLPAPQNELDKFGFSNLPSLNHITSGIESRLGKYLPDQ